MDLNLLALIGLMWALNFLPITGSTKTVMNVIFAVLFALALIWPYIGRH